MGLFKIILKAGDFAIFNTESFEMLARSVDGSLYIISKSDREYQLDKAFGDKLLAYFLGGGTLQRLGDVPGLEIPHRTFVPDSKVNEDSGPDRNW